MVAIRSTNSAIPPPQVGLGQIRLAQAQREADVAEARAKQLREQANDAEQQAQQSNENVRRIVGSNQREALTYGSPKASRPPDVPVKVQKLIEQMYAATSNARTQSGNPLKADVHAAPVVNVQGQATGRIVNVSA